MSSALDLDSAPADSTLGRANAVRKAYLALAETTIDFIALRGGETPDESKALAEASGAATKEVHRAMDELRAHLEREAKEDAA